MYHSSAIDGKKNNRKKLLPFLVLAWCMVMVHPGTGSSAVKEKLLDSYYAGSVTKFSFRLLYGGVNSSTTYRSLHDVRGGGVEGEYEKMNASGFFSGVIGLGYVSLDDSSSSQEHYVKGPYLKVGFNLMVFSSPTFLTVKLGPDIRFIQVRATDNNSEVESYTGLGMGVNLALNVSIKPKWFVGGGIREGILNFGDEELKTRYLFLTLQRTF